MKQRRHGNGGQQRIALHFFFSSRRRHTRSLCDWSSDVCSSDLDGVGASEVLFLDRQIDPVKGRLIHADLRRLVQGQEVEITVRLELEGEPAGTKERSEERRVGKEGRVGRSAVHLINKKNDVCVR